MTARDEITILQHAAEKAIENGFLATQDRSILGVDYTLDPFAVAIRFQPSHGHSVEPIYLDELFPLWEREWARAFWGTQLVGDNYFGLLPSWQYHQHKLLSLWQQKDREAFFHYIEVFL